MMQAAETIITKNNLNELLCSLILLCKGFDADQKPIWAYLCIKPSMAQAFKEARDRGNIDISEFGTVLESGNGLEPAADVRVKMERDFGVNHAGAEALLAHVAKINAEKATQFAAD